MEDYRQPRQGSKKSIFIVIGIIVFVGVVINLLYPIITKPFTTYAPPSSKKPIPANGTLFILSVTPKVAGDNVNGQAETCAEILRKQFSQLSFPVEVRASDDNIELYIGSSDFLDIGAIEDILDTDAKLSFHLVHRESRGLAQEVASGEEIVPGYKILPHTAIEHKTGEITTEQVLIRSKKELTQNDVKSAFVDPRDTSIVNIELTEAGGKKMEVFTLSLTQSVDMIATVLDGKVINYAMLNAERLGRNFVISGLQSKQEADKLVRSLQSPLTSTLKVIEQRPYSR